MISLKDYVKRRNGVHLGHSKSLSNMLTKSLGAKSFDSFWIYWNPIWSYYLNLYIYKPSRRFFHPYIAIILTFIVSGFIHDLVSFFIYKKTSFFITIWFLLMSFVVVFSKAQKIEYDSLSIIIKSIINVSIILGCFCITKYLIVPYL